ncbi:MAG: hypothetical protein R6U28_00215 [Cyclonatronaceae bacterium]
MDIQFDGFQSALPVFWVFILLAGALFLSWWTYRRIEGLSRPWRWTLTGLRAAAFLLLLALLLNPVLTMHEDLKIPVRIALMLDNSQSTTIEKGDYDGEPYYRDLMDRLTPERSGEYEHLELALYGFDDKLIPADSPSELNLDGTRTDIDQALADFMDLEDRHDALILVTDGIATSGRDPSATASRVPVPVYTIGIGDTTRQNDLVVQRVMHNPTASLNSTMRVQASILNDGFPDQDIPVQLLRDGDVLEEKTIRSSEGRSVQQVAFELGLDEEGVQQYQIHVPQIPGEWTTENNTRWFSVDVRDDRIRILHLAYEMHPDTRAIRQYLQEDRQIFMENRTWIRDDRYVEGSLPDRPDTLDLVIFHGFPHRDLDGSHARQVAERFTENALFIISTPGQDISRLSALFQGQLPIRYQSGYSWQDVQVWLSESQINHAILDFGMPEELRMPTVRGGIRDANGAQGANVLLYTAYRGSPTRTPFLAVQTAGGRNIAHLNGFHFYRWALNTRQDSQDFWYNLLNNTVKWTASGPDEELLDLRPAAPVFQLGEPVLINGFLRDETGEPEENAVIDITVESEDLEDRSYVMSNEGEGRYEVEVGNLPQGSYVFTGTASRRDREVDSRSGQFTVGGINRELFSTIRNDELLTFIAAASGGHYLTHDQTDELFDHLRDDIGLEQRLETTTETVALHRHPFWFILLVILLTFEWAIRKYRSLS